MTRLTALLHPARHPSVVCLLALVAIGCRGATPSEEESHPAPVNAEQVRRAALQQWTELFGTSQPLLGHAALISAGVEGRVVEVLPDLKGQPVCEGQQVVAGQVIVQLDDRIPRANRAKLVAAAKELDELEEQTDFAVDQAKLEVDRLTTLRPPGVADDALPLVSRIDLEKARIALKDAKAKENAAIARQKSAVEELKALDAQLSFYTLRAPIAGRLGLVRAMPGQNLAVGTVVADVVSLDDIDILCFVAPFVAPRLRLGQPARLTRYDSTALDEAPPPAGQVVFIAVQGQAEGSFAVKARFPNRDFGLRANALVALQVLTQSKKDVLSLPTRALSADQVPPGVILVAEEKDKEGKSRFKARRLQAIVGIRDRSQDLVELLGLRDPAANQDVSLRDDMRFVVEGGTGLETGDPVELIMKEK